MPFSIIQAPTLTVEQPSDGATFENGAIPVQGVTTNASTVTVSATHRFDDRRRRRAGLEDGRICRRRGRGRQRRPGRRRRPPRRRRPQVATDGTYEAAVELTAGKWSITTTAASAQARTTTITRTVNVVFKGVNLVVTLSGEPGGGSRSGSTA